MERFIKLLLALLLLPTLLLGAAELVELFKATLGQWKNVSLFAAGAVTYVVIHYAWYNFSRMYVFGHEMTHALAAF